jgi:hypothetical protein
MSIKDMQVAKQNKKILNEVLDTNGIDYRLTLSKRIIEIAQQIVTDNGYKNAWTGLGRMVALKNAISDDYMLEKIMHGMKAEEDGIQDCVANCGKFPRVNRLDDVI